MNQPLIWVLADDRAGNRAQCLGVADRLGIPYETKEIRYNTLVKLPNSLRGATLIGVDGDSAASLKAPWPDVVIAAGRRTAPIARYIKRKHPDAKLVQLMWPDAAPEEFDCIVLPSHDRDHGEAENILRVLGAPHRITASVLETARIQWRGPLSEYSTPRIALLVGGGNKYGDFAASDWTELGRLAGTLTRNSGGSLLLTTSRRTSQHDEESLLKALDSVPMRLYGKQQFEHEENPYRGYLAHAEAIIVTADSIAMCSEACATGKPVYFFLPSTLAAKHSRFANTLIAGGYAFPLAEEFTDIIRKPLRPEPLDSASTVAAHIQSRWIASKA